MCCQSPPLVPICMEHKKVLSLFHWMTVYVVKKTRSFCVTLESIAGREETMKVAG